MPNICRDDGSSLIESLMACAILATALLSAGHVSSAALTLTVDARDRTVATLLAAAKLEELRITSNPSDGVETVDAQGQPATNESSRRYERRWTVARVSEGVEVLTVIASPLPVTRTRKVTLTGARVAQR